MRTIAPDCDGVRVTKKLHASNAKSLRRGQRLVDTEVVKQ